MTRHATREIPQPFFTHALPCQFEKLNGGAA